MFGSYQLPSTLSRLTRSNLDARALPMSFSLWCYPLDNCFRLHVLPENRCYRAQGWIFELLLPTSCLSRTQCYPLYLQLEEFLPRVLLDDKDDNNGWTFVSCQHRQRPSASWPMVPLRPARYLHPSLDDCASAQEPTHISGLFHQRQRRYGHWVLLSKVAGSLR